MGLMIQSDSLCDKAWEAMNQEQRVHNILEATKRKDQLIGKGADGDLFSHYVLRLYENEPNATYIGSNDQKWRLFWVGDDSEAPKKGKVKWAQHPQMKQWGESLGRSRQESDFTLEFDKISRIRMWKAEKQPFITGLQFYDGSKWIEPKIGHSHDKNTMTEYPKMDDDEKYDDNGDYFDHVEVALANDPEFG